VRQIEVFALMPKARCSDRIASWFDVRQVVFVPLHEAMPWRFRNACWVRGSDEDWLFHQCQRITDALNKGEVALAQIYGLRIPIVELDDQRLRRLAVAGVAKWTFNPGEPRIPKGEPHAGEWTTGSGAAAAPSGSSSADTVANDGDDEAGGDDGSSDASPAPELSAITADDASQGVDPIGSAGGSPASSGPAIQYRIIEPGDGTGAPPSGGLAATVAAAEAAAGSLLGQLSPETMGGLVQLAARMSAPTLFLGILFIPTNGSVVVEGAVAGAPDLSTSYDRDTGILQVWQDDGAGGNILLDTGHIGVDGQFYGNNGTAIGRALPNGAIVDPDTLPGYRSQSNTGPGAVVRPLALADTAAQPKLCPDPGPDQPGARPKDILYQQYIGMLVNGRELPAGLAVNLVNPATGNIVHFDDCQLTTGIMIDAKGTGYAAILAQGSDKFVWTQIQQKMLNQADAQLNAARDRPIEWYFAEEPVADYVRALFYKNDLPITVIYAPRLR
jgi:hypothetical protein